MTGDFPTVEVESSFFHICIKLFFCQMGVITEPSMLTISHNCTALHILNLPGVSVLPSSQFNDRMAVTSLVPDCEGGHRINPVFCFDNGHCHHARCGCLE